MDRIVRRGRCVRADLGGGAFVLFVDVPKDLSPDTRSALNALVLALRDAIAAEQRKKETEE